jgi:glutaminyl-tRNA synthetase
VVSGAMVEPAAIGSDAYEPMQFERQGYFRQDGQTEDGRPIFIRTVGLRDTFAKVLAANAVAGPH